MPVIQAQDIVQAAIQDSQNQTTNRTALYDYTDRIHQRILRESQWRFLLSDPQYFATIPGVSGYNLTTNSTPSGVFQTQNAIANFFSLAPGSVFDLTANRQIQEDSDSSTSLNTIVFRDGSLRFGPPRTYQNSISNPGVLYIKPVPDNQNLYYPVPETPVVTQAPQDGCLLANRIYWGVVTFIDSQGGESTQCVVPFTIGMFGGNVVTVESPGTIPSVITGNQTTIVGWNLYMGYSQGNYFIQNASPIPLGTSWTESGLGLNAGALQVPSLSYLPPSTSNTFLGILADGQLSTTTGSTGFVPSFWAIQDTDNVTWQVTVDPTTHILETIATGPLGPSVKVFPAIYLTDTSGISTWRITVQTDGTLMSTLFSTPPSSIAINTQPPATSSIQPLNAYIIQFRYYQSRNQIVNPTDVLQIPYNYKDIVVAGVNYLASLYMDRQENREPSAKTIVWRKDFDLGLAQIRRDLRINFRKTDFISPDQTTQTVVGNQQGIPTQGW